MHLTVNYYIFTSVINSVLHQVIVKMQTDNFQPATLPELLLQLAEQLKQQSTPAGRQQAAANIIKEYFQCYHIPEVRQFLWQMLAGSLSCDKMERLKKSSQLHELIFSTSSPSC